MEKRLSMASLYNAYTDSATFLFNQVRNSDPKLMFVFKMNLHRYNNSFDHCACHNDRCVNDFIIS